MSGTWKSGGVGGTWTAHKVHKVRKK
jgi:hypothetical protein